MQRNQKTPLANRVIERNAAIKFYCNHLVPAFVDFVRELNAEVEAGKQVFIAGPRLSKKWEQKDKDIDAMLRKYAPKNVRWYFEIKFYQSLGYSMSIKGDYTVLDQIYPDGGGSVSYKQFDYVGFDIGSNKERLANYMYPMFKALTVKQVFMAEIKLRKLEQQKSAIEDKISAAKSITKEV